MKTQILKPNKKTYSLAKEIISTNNLVAFPTETVYGLGANACSNDACDKIFIAKGRPQDNPLIVHVGRKKDILKYVENVNTIEQKLIKYFMPGPISIVFKKNNSIANSVTCNNKTVAIRMPSNRVARKFINACNCPIAAPSANTSKRPSPTCAKHVLDDLNGKIELIINGGNTKIGIESTVVKVENNAIYILRPGKINKEMLSKKLHIPVIDIIKPGTVTESPGTKYTHYCPSCEMILVKNDIVKNAISLYKHMVNQNKKVIIFCLKDNQKFYLRDNINHVVFGKNSNDVCKNLFHLLRDYEKQYDLIIAENVENGSMQDGFYNRIIKSCSGKTI